MINLVTFPLGFGAAFALRRYKDGLRAENLAVVKVSFTGTCLENEERIQLLVQMKFREFTRCLLDSELIC
jgi:hypothetical protein